MEPRGTRDKEQNMKGDKTVIEYLNKALRHELTAVNHNCCTMRKGISTFWKLRSSSSRRSALSYTPSVISENSATTEALTVAEEGPA